jgi:hypothetical protein
MYSLLKGPTRVGNTCKNREIYRLRLAFLLFSGSLRGLNKLSKWTEGVGR